MRGGSREAEGIPRPDSPFEPSSSPQGPSDSPQGLSPRPHTVSHTVRNCGRSVWFSLPLTLPQTTPNTHTLALRSTVFPPPPSYPARFSILPCSFLSPICSPGGNTGCLHDPFPTPPSLTYPPSSYLVFDKWLVFTLLSSSILILNPQSSFLIPQSSSSILFLILPLLPYP